MAWGDQESVADTLQRIPLIFGAVGHRNLRSEDLPAFRERLKAKIFLPCQAHYPETPIHIIYALAEGADRLVAKVGLECGARLIVPLPFEQREYERDFETAESLSGFRSMLWGAVRVLRIPFAERCSAKNIQDHEGPTRVAQYAGTTLRSVSGVSSPVTRDSLGSILNNG